MRSNILILLILSSFLNSCIVLHSGSVSSGPLLSVTDKYVDIATGESQAVQIFWISTELNSRMVLEAKSALFKNRPLRKGEYYSNFTCDVSKTLVLGVVFVTNVIVSAEVLKVESMEGTIISGNDSLRKDVSKNFNNLIGAYNPKSYFKNAVDSFTIGEKIFYSEGMTSNFAVFEIAAISGNNVSIKPVYHIGSNIIVSQKEILYSAKKPLEGFNIGEIVDANLAIGSAKGTIVATSDVKALIHLNEEGGGFVTLKTTRLKKIN